ncbi:MAG: hypothetical protein WC532_01390 [Candidatus Omnitrophota bacterium]
MVKAKAAFKKRITEFFMFHIWLKLIALALAILVWFYVRGDIIAR